MTIKALMSIDDVAAETPWKPDTIRKAIRATNPNSWPPPLKAKRASKGQYVVRRQDFLDWIDGMADA